MDSASLAVLKHLPQRNKRLVHFATEGISHFLGLLEGSVEFVIATGGSIQVVTEFHKPLGYLGFDEIFDIREDSWGNAKLDKSLWPDGSEIELVTYRPGRHRKYEIRIENRVIELMRLDQPTARWLRTEPKLTHGFRMPQDQRFQRILKRLVLSSRLQSRIAETLQRFPLPNERYIGVHFRNSDRTTDAAETLRMLDAAVSQTRCEAVWLSSDDPGAIDYFQKQRSSLQFYWLEKPFARNTPNLHFGVEKPFAADQFLHALSDIYMLSHASFFVPALSSKSGWIRLVDSLRLGNQGFFGGRNLAAEAQ